VAYQWTKTDAAAPERVLLIGLDCGDYDAEASMAELERLTDTAGGPGGGGSSVLFQCHSCYCSRAEDKSQ